MVGDVPITRYWLIPTEVRPKMFTPHPSMSSDEIRERTQSVWDSFYNWSAIWRRSSLHANSPRPRSRSCSFPSSIARCTPERASPPTAHAARSRRGGRVGPPSNARDCSKPDRCPNCNLLHGNMLTQWGQPERSTFRALRSLSPSCTKRNRAYSDPNVLGRYGRLGFAESSPTTVVHSRTYQRLTSPLAT